MITAILLPQGLEDRPLKITVNERNIEEYYSRLHGGYIEAVYPVGCSMYIVDDLEGHTDLEVNTFASVIATGEGIRMGPGAIYGNALLVGRPDEDGYDTNIPEPILQAMSL